MRAGSVDACAALSEVLRKGRQDAGLTQQELATKSLVSLGMIRKIEGGGIQEPGFFIVGRVGAVIRDELAATQPALASTFESRIGALFLARPSKRVVRALLDV